MRVEFQDPALTGLYSVEVPDGTGPAGLEEAALDLAIRAHRAEAQSPEGAPDGPGDDALAADTERMREYMRPLVTVDGKPLTG